MLNNQSDICKELGLQASPLGVGKALNKHIWLHISALRSLPVENKAAILDVMDQNFCVVRIDIKASTFQLSDCPDFDNEREPTIHGHKSYEVVNGVAQLIKEQNAKSDNFLIFHHKHLFVNADYEGFDVSESKAWSLLWRSQLPRTRAISSRIGRLNGWNEALKAL